MNPRAAINDLLPFQGSPFSHLGISPKCLFFLIIYRKQTIFIFHPHSFEGAIVIRQADDCTERVGFEPTRPYGQTVFKTASL